MPEFIYLIHPLRHELFTSPTSEEMAAIEAHFEYLKEATSQGRVVLAGPCLDETFGLVIITMESREAAQAFMLNDPAVKNNVVVAELHPMRIALLQGR